MSGVDSLKLEDAGLLTLGKRVNAHVLLKDTPANTDLAVELLAEIALHEVNAEPMALSAFAHMRNKLIKAFPNSD